MDAWKNRNEREVKSMNIKRRRLKLAEMLSEERTKFEVCLCAHLDLHKHIMWFTKLCYTSI